MPPENRSEKSKYCQLNPTQTDHSPQAPVLELVLVMMVVGTTMDVAPPLGTRGWGVVNVNSLGLGDGNNHQMGVDSGG